MAWSIPFWSVLSWAVVAPLVVACSAAAPAADGDSGGSSESGGGPAQSCGAPVGVDACAAVSVCDVYTCGGKASIYNHEGCPRQDCALDAECDAGWRCYPLVLDTACATGKLRCADAAGECSCGEVESCSANRRAHCLPESFYPASDDCDVAQFPCGSEIGDWHDALLATATAHAAAGATELADEVAGCSARAAQARVSCGEPRCAVLCAIAPCGHADLASCTAACDGATSALAPTRFDTLLDAVARDAASACNCSACADGDEVCMEIWSCAG